MTRERKDCRCARVRHHHGTEAAYTRDGCRCLPCALARAAYTDALAAGQNHEGQTVPVHGTRRRLQALMLLGWSGPELGALIGVNAEIVGRITRLPDHRTVLRTTRDRVARVYDQLWLTPSSGKHAIRIRHLAERKGWVPAAAWDDDTIDNPDARPASTRGVRVRELAACGTPAAARRHYRRGEPLDDACRNADRRARAERRPAA